MTFLNRYLHGSRCKVLCLHLEVLDPWGASHWWLHLSGWETRATRGLERANHVTKLVWLAVCFTCIHGEWARSWQRPTPIHPDRRPEETCSSTLKKRWDQKIVCWGAVKGWEGLKVANGRWADRHGWFRDVPKHPKPDMYKCDTNVFSSFIVFYMYDVIQVHHITLMTAYVYIYISFTSHCLAISNDKKQSLKWALVLQKSSNANAPTIRYPDDIGQGELEIEECAKVLEPFSHALWDFFGCNLFQLNPPDISRYFFRFLKFHTYIYIYIFQLYVYDNYMYIYICTYYPAVWCVVVFYCTFCWSWVFDWWLLL